MLRIFKSQWWKMLPPRRLIFLSILWLLCFPLCCIGLAGGTDLDGDGIDDAYELFFGLDPGNPADALLNYDNDTLINLDESVILTDPFVSDTDRDGWHDGVDRNPLSRAYIPWGEPWFTSGDYIDYAAPGWLISAYKIGGQWLTNPACWHVSSETENAVASLNLNVDRSLLRDDVILALSLRGGQGALFYVDLINSNNVVIASDLFGNLIDKSDEVEHIKLRIPLRTYSDASGISLRCSMGEVTVYNTLLYIDRDGDGLDADQEAQVGTSDSKSDTDGDGLSDFNEVLVRGTDPLTSDFDETAGLETDTGSVLAEETRIIALARQESISFRIVRSALDGGGKRQSSMSFVIEDSIAQASAIGLSLSTIPRLNAGFQHGPDKLLEIQNASASPDLFNPQLGEFTTLSYVLSTIARSVTIEVYKDEKIIKLVENQRQGGGLHALRWDGKDADGNVATPGEWSFRVYAVSYAGRHLTLDIPVRIKQAIPAILSVSDAPDPFFRLFETNVIYYTTASKSGGELDVVITLEDAECQSVASIAFDNQAIGSHTQFWDGTDDLTGGGIPQPDGLYVYRINAAREGNKANEKTGAIVLVSSNTAVIASADGRVKLRYKPDTFTIEITGAAAPELTDAARAIVANGLFVQSPVYDITAVPSTLFSPPAILTFQYDPTITGDIEEKLQIRKYNPESNVWEMVDRQFIDFANHRVIAEIDELSSLFALFTGRDTTAPVITIISPEPVEYLHTLSIDIIYEVEDPIINGVSAGVVKEIVYLNGEEYTDKTINLSNLLGENVLTVVAWDAAGNIGRSYVRFIVVLEASVTLKPEALKVNPGILTAFVTFPEGYDISSISDATCDGAAYERMMLNDDGTAMIIKFRRADIEKALAEAGETIDTTFIVRGKFVHETATYIFKGIDTITKIIDERRRK